jgi:hypothetical protein
MAALFVSMGCQSCREELICECSSLWEAIHALLHFHVDAVLVFFLTKVVTVNYFIRD